MRRFEPPPPLPERDRPAQEPHVPWASPPQGYGTPSQGDVAASRAPWGPPVGAPHPRGTAVLVLGILSIVLAPVFGPFAWAMGRSALREADAAPVPPVNRSALQVGMVLGIIGTVFLVLALLALLVLVGFVTIASVATT